MATYSIDSSRQQLRATGIVEALRRWDQDAATGRRTQSDVQDIDPGTGLPLWAVEITYLSESYGRQSTEVSRVTVPAAQQPVVGAFDVVQFEGLSVSVSVNKQSGQLREFWRAEGLAGQSRKAAA